MLKYLFSFLILIIFTLTSRNLFAQNGWAVVNSNITENLSKVIIVDNVGERVVILGNNSIYYNFSASTNSNWTKFVITNNSNDSLILSRVKFSDILNYFGDIYISGTDTVNQKAIIFKMELDLTSILNYNFEYIGPAGSSINAISLVGNGDLMAVGDNGFVVYSDDLINYYIKNVNTTKNLTCITTYGTDKYPIVAGNDFLIKFNYISLNLFNYFEIINAQGINFKNIIASTGFYVYCLDSMSLYIYNRVTGNISIKNNYDFGPIIGTGICPYSSNALLVATSHGVYKGKMFNSNNILEVFPSTLSYNLNDIHSLYPKAYAVGNNGLILKTNNVDSVETKPYAMILTEGSCVNSTYQLVSDYIGTNTTCQWFINGTYYSNNCNYVNSPIQTTIGNDTLKFIVTYPNLTSDTVSKIIYVSAIPDTSILVSITDTSYLCKNGTKTILLQNSESGVQYNLRNNFTLNNPISFGSKIGNGNLDSFQTVLIDEASDFYLQATDSLNVCTIFFNDTLRINIDETKANFYASNINALKNEPISFHSRSRDADSASWKFGLNSNPSLGNNIDMLNIHYIDTGLTNINLIAISEHGCMDTIDRTSTQITNEPNYQDSCWAFKNSGGSMSMPINDTQDNNIVMYGNFYNGELASKNGISGSNVYNELGSYIAKYSLNGTLKWATKISHCYTTFNPVGYNIPKVMHDEMGNIYAIIHQSPTTNCGPMYLYNRSGDSISLTHTNGQLFNGLVSILLKLDSNGNYIKHINLVNANFFDFNMNNKKEIIISGHTTDYGAIEYLNIDTSIVLSKFINNNQQGENGFLLNLDSAFNFKWCTKIESNNVNIQYPLHYVAIDDSSNIYVIGQVELYNTLFSENGDSTIIYGTAYASGGYKTDCFVVKYDATGNLKWINNQYYSNTHACNSRRSLVVDKNLNVYFSVGNELLGNSILNYNINVKDPLGNITSYNKQLKNIIVKLNSNGITQWVAGSNSFGTIASYSLLKLHNDSLYTFNGRYYYFSLDSNATMSYYSRDMLDSISYPYKKTTINIACYDTSGHLIWICMDTIDNKNSSIGVSNFIKKKSDQTIYFNGGLQTNNIPLSFCNSNIVSTNNASFLAKSTFNSCNLFTVNNDTHYVFTHIPICYGDSYLFPDSFLVSNVTTPIYHDILYNLPSGIDSINRIILDIKTNYNFSFLNNVCKGDSLTTYDSTIIYNIQNDTLYTSHFTSTFGCDSNVANLIKVTNFDSTIVVSNNTLTSNNQSNGYAFQWINCTTNQLLTNETNKFITVSDTDYYAVIITKNGCSDTSECKNISIPNLINDINVSSFINIYPNPTKEYINIDFIEKIKNIRVELTDLTGRLLEEWENKNVESIKLKINFITGIYFVKIIFNNENYVYKIIKY